MLRMGIAEHIELEWIMLYTIVHEYILVIPITQ